MASKKIIVTTSLINATMLENVSTKDEQGNFYITIESGALAKTSYLALQSNEGWGFSENPKLTIYDSEGNILIERNLILGDFQGFYCWNLRYVSSYSDIYQIASYAILTANATIDNKLNDYPCIRFYKVDKNIISQISSQRFADESTEWETRYSDIFDYVNSFIQYPFDINELQQPQVMVFGYHSLNGITAPTISSQFYTIESEVKKINGYYNNKTDIGHCDIVFNVPYYGRYSLDNDFINRNIKFKYVIDILNNECKIYVQVVNEDNTTIDIDILNCSIGFDVPFTTQSQKIKYKIKEYETIQTDLFCVVKQTISNHDNFNNSLHFNSVNELGDYGFVKAKNIDFNNADIPPYAKQLIEKIFNEGIVINLTNI